MQVMISHPNRISVGVDLLDFPSIFWAETNYSVFTNLQANRRSWRVGQREDVLVRYYCYRDTIQEVALNIVADKASAANRIDGNADAVDTLAAQGGENDIASMLMNMLATGQDAAYESGLAAAFAKVNAKPTSSFMGAFTADDDALAQRELPTPEPVVSTQPDSSTTTYDPATSEIYTASGMVQQSLFDLMSPN